MSEAIIKKDGTDYPLQTMPLHYPADRVYLDGDITKDAESAIDGKVSKSGDTMTGDLTLSKQGTVLKIRASGSRYTNLTSAASSSDKDIVLPNKSGTIALTSDIPATIVRKSKTITLGSGAIGTVTFQLSDFTIPNGYAVVVDSTMVSVSGTWDVGCSFHSEFSGGEAYFTDSNTLKVTVTSNSSGGNIGFRVNVWLSANRTA